MFETLQSRKWKFRMEMSVSLLRGREDTLIPFRTTQYRDFRIEKTLLILLLITTR